MLVYTETDSKNMWKVPGESAGNAEQTATLRILVEAVMRDRCFFYASCHGESRFVDGG
jgi:hypothetical protein